MTNRMALILFLLLAGFFVLDTLVFDWGIWLALARRGVGLLQTLAVWR